MTNKEFADGLRMVANFYERHEGFPQPTPNSFDVFSVDDETMLEQVARTLGTVEKFTLGDDLFGIRRVFGPLVLRVIVDRRIACTRRVVGTERVEAQFSPAYDREIVEWDCHSLLKDVGEVA